MNVLETLMRKLQIYYFLKMTHTALWFVIRKNKILTHKLVLDYLAERPRKLLLWSWPIRGEDTSRRFCLKEIECMSYSAVKFGFLFWKECYRKYFVIFCKHRNILTSSNLVTLLWPIFLSQTFVVLWQPKFARIIVLSAYPQIKCYA